MSTWLLDTNIVSLLVRRDQITYGHLRAATWAGDRVILSPVVEFESRRGLARKGATTLTQRFEIIIATLDYCPFDRQVWLRAADLWAQLRQQGTPLQDADILIAA